MAQLISATIYISPNTVTGVSVSVKGLPGSLSTTVSGEYLKVSYVGSAGSAKISATGYLDATTTLSDDATVYVTMHQDLPTFISKLSNGTDTYTIKDENAYHSGDLAPVATTGSYNSLTDTPAIPLVYNSTITFTQGGVTKGTITTNQSTAATIALDAGGGSVAVDNSTITKNASDEIQAVAVIDQNTGIIKPWSGTGAEYEDISEIDPDTLYITDDIGLPATEIGQITEDVNELNAHKVVEFQAPTAANNYTWYRKYADGWVEQGGYYAFNASRASTAQVANLPIEMQDTNYSVYLQIKSSAHNYQNGSGPVLLSQATTSISVQMNDEGSSTLDGFYWRVSGMAA